MIETTWLCWYRKYSKGKMGGHKGYIYYSIFQYSKCKMVVRLWKGAGDTWWQADIRQRGKYFLHHICFNDNVVSTEEAKEACEMWITLLYSRVTPAYYHTRGKKWYIPTMYLNDGTIKWKDYGRHE